MSALANLTNLKTLDLSGTDVSDVSALAHLTNLEEMRLWYTDVSDVSALANLTNLKTLDLRSTDVSDVSALAHLTNLETLDLSFTDVSDVSALAHLTKLETLDLSGTGISDVSALANLTNLKTLDLTDCPLSHASRYTHITALRKKGVNVTFPIALIPDAPPVVEKSPVVLIHGLSIDPSKDDDNGKAVPNEGGNAFILLKQYGNTCGPTSLEMVLHYYGISATMADIFNEGGIHTVEAGTTPGEMKQALDGLGLPAYYYDEDTKNYRDDPLAHLRYLIDNNRPPCILVASSGGYHWVVVVGYNTKTNEYLLADPSDPSFWWISHEALDAAWRFDRQYAGGRTFWSTGFTPKIEGALGRIERAGKDLAVWAVIDEYTAIVPKAPTTHLLNYSPLWSEMQGVRITGTVKVLPAEAAVGGILDWIGIDTNLGTHGWERTLTFKKKFNFYRGVGIKELFSIGVAELHGSETVGTKSVKLWGRIGDGWDLAGRGKMWVMVRAYRGSESPAAPAQIVHTRLSASPAETSLLPNYPNPFNPETWIPYQLAKPAEVKVSIYSADGKLVRRLDLGQMPSGVYSSRARAAYWDGRNAQGEPVASGIYFYTLTAGDFFATRKMVIRK